MRWWCAWLIVKCIEYDVHILLNWLQTHCKGKKVKEADLYSAVIVVPHTQGARVWITQCYLQFIPYLPLPRKHSPDDASPDWGCGHLIAAYYSFIYPERMKGWVGLVGWPTADGLLGYLSAADWSQDSESSPVRDRRSTTVPCNQHSPTVHT